MLSQTAEYALRAAVWLADNPGTPLTTQEISAATQVPLDYLYKVMQALGRAGVVTAQRGKKGGFCLSRPAEQISVLDIVNTVDPIRRIKRCPLGLSAHAEKLCPLHKRLDDAAVTIERAFADTALSGLLDPKHRIKPLCNTACE